MTAQGPLPVESPEDPGPGGQVRLRLQVAYDGTGFHGWARQPGLRSVQEELETALRRALRVDAKVPVRVAVAGRTDAGVHAESQICHADVPAPAWERAGSDRSRRGSPRPGAASPGEPAPLAGIRLDPPRPVGEVASATATLRRINALLPADIRVLDVDVAPAGFDARWSAQWRAYRYRIADSPGGCDPNQRARTLWVRQPLDLAAMAAATDPFLGEHDFAAYCRPREGASTVRTLLEADWSRGRDDVLALALRADAFCHSMARSLVGAFLAVGSGRWPVERPAELLAAFVRGSQVPVAPAHGLTLVAVGYPPDSELAGQAQRARRWRGR